MPALRERREDIALIAAHFLEKHAAAYRRPLSGFTPEALGLLAGYSFPGNVRELSNAVERAVAISAGPLIGAAALPPEVREGQGGSPAPGTLVQMPYREAIERSRDRVSREYLSALLHELGGNVTRAAERAGMERESLHRLLKRHGIKSEDFKRSE
jgi:DNA-binding NtrC family response regulator